MCVCVCVCICRSKGVASSFFACGSLLSDDSYLYYAVAETNKLR